MRRPRVERAYGTGAHPAPGGWITDAQGVYGPANMHEPSHPWRMPGPHAPVTHMDASSMPAQERPLSVAEQIDAMLAPFK